MNWLASRVAKRHRKIADRYEKHPWLAYLVLFNLVFQFHRQMMTAPSYRRWMQQHAPILAKVGGDYG